MRKRPTKQKHTQPEGPRPGGTTRRPWHIPKRRQSKTRSRKRRTHYKAETPNVSTCSSTGQAHMFHRAHWYEGKLYYKGRVVMEKETAEA